jgi:hypothetical protein
MFRKHDFSIRRRDFLRGILAAGSFATGARFAWSAAAPDRLVVAMSVGVDSINPYGHSDSPLYGLWGHVMEAVVDTDYAEKAFPQSSLNHGALKATSGRSNCART